MESAKDDVHSMSTKVTVAFPYVSYVQDGITKYNDDNGSTPKEIAARRSVKTLGDLVRQIKTHEHTKNVCLKLRSGITAEEKKHIKMTQLFRIYFGEFELVANDKGYLKYQDAGLKEHPGIVCFDADNLDPINLGRVRESLAADPYVLVGFLSPRGNGYKWLVRIPADKTKHHAHYRALVDYYQELLDVELDEVCINPSRCCFMSHDPNVFVNTSSVTWTKQKDLELPVYKPHVGNIDSDVEAAVKRVLSSGADLAHDYSTWLQLAASLASLGEGGRGFFHELAAVNDKYDRRDSDALFTKILRSGTRSTIGTFFFMIKGIKQISKT